MMDAHSQYLFETQEALKKRGTFHNYFPLKGLKGVTVRGLRLMDLNLSLHRQGDAGYLDANQPGEFSVVDTVTLEKGRFEWPETMEVLDLKRMIEGRFGATAHRIGVALWIV